MGPRCTPVFLAWVGRPLWCGNVHCFTDCYHNITQLFKKEARKASYLKSRPALTFFLRRILDEFSLRKAKNRSYYVSLTHNTVHQLTEQLIPNNKQQNSFEGEFGRKICFVREGGGGEGGRPTSVEMIASLQCKTQTKTNIPSDPLLLNQLKILSKDERFKHVEGKPALLSQRRTRNQVSKSSKTSSIILNFGS